MSEAATLGRMVRISAAPFIATAFIGASLIFLVQPMFARMATPLLGGAPAVWNVSLVCFQAALLLGYAYAHALSRLSSLKAQVLIHAVVLTAGFLCLPLRMSGLLGDPPADAPALWLIGTFAVSIAPPFAALSATAPLIQSWYARSGLSDAADPYHLYAASNIGSLVGLAAYPLLIEPFTSLTDQSQGWSVGYALLAAVLLFSGWSIVQAGIKAGAAPAQTSAAPAPAWREKLIWLALSFAPSSLLVGATSHITTDVAAAPFLWAPPLMIYLLTFVIAFSKKPLISHQAAVLIAPLAAAAAALTLLSGSKSVLIGMSADLLALFFIALACHGALNARRPDARYLTQFYLIMSLGGVLGGAFNALLAPVLFSNVLEYPLMLVAAVALLAIGNAKISRPVLVLLALAAVAALGAIVITVMDLRPPPIFLLLFILPAGAAIILSRRAPLGAAIALACTLPIGAAFDVLRPHWTGRSFFGVVRVVDLPAENDPGPGFRFMMHGTTLHGVQSLKPERALIPGTYYGPAGAIGQSFKIYSDARQVGVVGLGAGSVACYRTDGQVWRFYEIDPLVVKVATNPAHFTFLSSCQPKADIVLGDARISLTNEPKDKFDLLLLDAFTSDSVPTHLMTKEAMQLYLSRLKPNGVLVFHISNRHLALKSVLSRVVEASGAHALYQHYFPDDAAKKDGATSSEVMLVSKSEAQLARARATGLWQDAPGDGQRPWTDDYSNIIGAMIERAAPSQAK
ncbi:MAG TPA: fused MFS/spermidine synthase [Hyphomonadaceae bacterium]|jgi:hypothetical protein|nr:fused MFS/spermidine synthase [Hyphomonadaceae bacterium]